MTELYSLLLFGLCGLIKFDVAAAVNGTCYVTGAFQQYQEGEIFQHPHNPCVLCECCADGIFTCTPRKCPEASCGILKQTKYSEDGCCKQCCEECDEECPELTCTYQVYKADSCCKSCGCKYNGVVVPQGPVGHKCDNCECLANGNVVCDRPPCPPESLKCVNPTYASSTNCTWVCPTGDYTCRRGQVVIPAGKVVRIKNKICTCNTQHFYTRAFCANIQEMFGERFRHLFYGKCLNKYRGSEILTNPLKYMQPQ